MDMPIEAGPGTEGIECSRSAACGHNHMAIDVVPGHQGEG